MMLWHLQRFKGLQGVDAILRFYAEEYSTYERNCRALNQVFFFLNRVWVPKQRTAEHKKMREAFEIFDLSQRIWERCILKKIRGEIMPKVLEILKQERRITWGDEEPNNDLQVDLAKPVIRSCINTGN